MIESLYHLLTSWGYNHPLHPPFTHLPLGLIIGAFIFGILSILLRHSPLATTARHCIVLAFAGLLPTVLLGIADWEHFYQGAMLPQIKAKLGLAAVLFVLLLLAILSGRRRNGISSGVLGLYALCLMTSGALGYFGGELVFKGDSRRDSSLPALAREGADVFHQNCTACHFTESAETKFGPGLKGLFSREKLTSSGQPLTEESVRRQITTPFKMMPPFVSFTPRQMDALIAYLKSL